MTDEERQRAKERAMANKERSSAATDWQSQSDEEARMPDDLVEMARLAQHDERMATGALYGDLADRIEELEARLTTCEKYRDAYAECDRIGTQAVRDLVTKLAKTVKALERIQGQPDYRLPSPQDIARTTLAELTGGKDA